MVEYHIQPYYVLLMTVNVTFALVVMLGACLCCKKKIPRDDLLGLDGMVKLKNPDEDVVNLNVVSSSDLNVCSNTGSDSDKRASTAPHRSLPDIPVTDCIELYETLTDALPSLIKDGSPSPILKKKSSISQHSSISQADEISSPYSRVKNSEHDYAKVLNAEHPYAQLNLPSSITNPQNLTLNSNNTQQDVIMNRLSLSNDNVQINENNQNVRAEIPAASAIAGMVSASQDLPYMTPPIATLHFSGDSQDSSKGYTSISVREPIANILAQQPVPILQAKSKSCDASDSHYATVSDDSDETYAAIDDPNARNSTIAAADVYTSGSETYAQIQPLGLNTIVVAAEINSASRNTECTRLFDQNVSNLGSVVQQSIRGLTDHVTPVIPHVDSLRAQMHSRQASSSSNNSSPLGNIGSPKPEKRQANSPLPPTPQSNSSVVNQIADSNNLYINSSRNSIISVLDNGCMQETDVKENVRDTSGVSIEEAPLQSQNEQSPSKDIEVMYAKVNKKNKFSRASASPQNTPDVARCKKLNTENQSVDLNDKRNCQQKKGGGDIYDHGYETIPATESYTEFEHNATCDDNSQQYKDNKVILRTPIQTNIHQQSDEHIYNCERIVTTADMLNSPYTKIHPESSFYKPKDEKSEYDPNYEVLRNTSTTSEDGYSKVAENKLQMDDGYSKICSNKSENKSVVDYSTDDNHNYESIAESKAFQTYKSPIPSTHDCDADHYSNINEKHLAAPSDVSLVSYLQKSKININDDLKLTLPDKSASPSSINSYSLLNTSSLASSSVTTNSSTMSSKPNLSLSQYESLTSETDPNYESLSYSPQVENHYERLHLDGTDNTEDISLSPEEPAKDTINDVLVHDFFQV